jgi:hypothetical protein
MEQASNKSQNKQMVLPIHCDVEILALLPDESLAGFDGPTAMKRDYRNLGIGASSTGAPELGVDWDWLNV